MRKSLFHTAFSALTIAFIIIVVGKYVIVAQAPVTGTWTADTRHKEKVGKAYSDDPNYVGVHKGNRGSGIQLNFERVSATGKHQNGNSYAFSDLQGLTEAQAMNGRVSFSLVREAGTIECEGTFVDGRGSGTFRFTPNRSFIDTMRSKGFDFEPQAVDPAKSHKYRETAEDRLFTAALLNVTSALADDLLSANFGKLAVDDLYKAAIFKVDGKFMSEMKATGFPNLCFEDLVKARIFNINADFVGKIASMGLANRDFEDMVKFSIFNVTPEFLGELKAAGLDRLDAEELVKARIFNISPEFVKQQKAADPSVTMEDLVRMKIGVKVHKDKTWN
jgi:hypothetical protein